MMTVSKIFEDSRYEMACTYIVNCLGETECFTRETKRDLFRIWGEEECTVRFLNTRELQINIQ